MVKMVFSDLDGTFLTPDKIITAENRNMLDVAYARGVQFVPCTGRNLSDIPSELLAHPSVSYAVCCNGSLVVNAKTGRVLQETLIEKRTVLGLYNELSSLQITFDVFADRRVYTERSRFGYIDTVELSGPTRDFIKAGRTLFDCSMEELMTQTGPVCRLNIFYHTKEDCDLVWDAVDRRAELRRSTSLPCNVEITDACAHKGAALEWLCGFLGVSTADVVAFGDNENDTTMLRAAGDGVAMENAVHACKLAADHLCASCTESGVSRYLMGRLSCLT